MCGNVSDLPADRCGGDRPHLLPSGRWLHADYTLQCSDATLTGIVQHALGEFYAVPEFTPGDGMHAEAMDNCDAAAEVTYSGPDPDHTMPAGVHHQAYLHHDGLL